MRTRLLAAGSVAFLALAGCMSMSQLASSNYKEMTGQFPYHAAEPVARELRYTYTNLLVLGGKPYGKPVFGADPQTLKDPGSAPRPPKLVLSALAGSGHGSATPNASDTLSDTARELSKRAGNMEKEETSRTLIEGTQALATATADTAVSTQAATASLQRAEATGQLFISSLNAMEAMVRAWTEATTRTLGEWVRDETGFIGPSAPPGAVLQVDFTYVVNGEKWHAESVIDFVAHATLIDGAGIRAESIKSYQLFTVNEKPGIAVPSDAIRLGTNANRFPPDSQRLVARLQKDYPFDPYLALAMSAALGDVERQVREHRAAQR